MHQKVYESQLIPTYQIFCTWITPAAETNTIGLLADALLASFFAKLFIKYALIRNILPVYLDSSLRQLYRDKTTPPHLPGPDSYREAKNSTALTRAATNQTAGPLDCLTDKSCSSAVI